MINGYLMNKDQLAAKIEDNKLTVIKEELLPLFLIKNGDVEAWIQSRAIDNDRIHSRLIKKALQLYQKDDVSTVMSVRAACITDSYWIKLKDDKLSYQDIQFTTDSLSDLALNGNLDIYSQADKLSQNRHTPELTNIGSFEKGWKLKDGHWWLVKAGSPEQYFSEMFAYKVGSYLGFNMAKYHLEKGSIWSEDFTLQKVNFEPAMSLIGDRTEDYTLNYKTFLTISSDCAAAYLDILYLDALLRNPDRHEYNYGVLRDQDNGYILGLAPNFDNNLSLISTGYPTVTERKNDLLLLKLNEFLQDNGIQYNPPHIPANEIQRIMDDIPINVHQEIILQFVMEGQSQFHKISKK